MASNRVLLSDEKYTINQASEDPTLFAVSSKMIEPEMDDPVLASLEKLEKQPAPNEEGSGEVENREEIGVRQCFVDFCKQTILHGWHYLVEYEDTTDSEDDTNGIVGPPKPSPKAERFGKRGHQVNQCSIHNRASPHIKRKRASRFEQNASRSRIPPKRTAYAYQNSQQYKPRQKSDSYDDSLSSAIWKENGKHLPN